jgi:glucan phosphoethanolaminetransferase (alkaline phosphatase superfamily)
MSPYSKALLKTILVGIVMFIIMNILMIQFNLRTAVFNSVLFDFDHPNYRLVQIASLAFTIVFGALCAYLGWLLSGRKNRNKGQWAVLCFLLNIWGLIFLIFLPPLEKAGPRHPT